MDERSHLDRLATEVVYDSAAAAPLSNGAAISAVANAIDPATLAQSGDGSGCHAGAKTMREAASAAGKSEILARYAADYPKGPHDQPQSMCPAFGSLRVGLRMRRTATILSGSACCVYGLTFTSHFYGARRTVGYVPFNSETLVTGKLFEDIREAVFKIADPGALRHRHRHQSLRADGFGRPAPAVAQGDQRRPHYRNRCAGLWRSDACGSQRRAGGRNAEICTLRGRGRPGGCAAHAQRQTNNHPAR